MAVFWVVAPCSLVEVYQRCDALMMEAARTSETLVNFYQTRRRYNPEDSHLHTRRRENLKPYLIPLWFSE
jgi:16S rRNA C1402 (ribose-2'-O) methylase RsmI